MRDDATQVGRNAGGKTTAEAAGPLGARLGAIFRAGRLRRWHSHPQMVEFDDRLDAHHARVARLIMALWPDASLALIRAALTHDDGENGETGTGDIPGPVKMQMPDWMQAWLASRETQGRVALWGDEPWLTLEEQDRLDFADLLDRLLLVGWARPELLNEPHWVKAARELDDAAAKLGLAPGEGFTGALLAGL